MINQDEFDKYKKDLKIKLAPAEQVLSDFHNNYYEKMLLVQKNINNIFAPLIEAIQIVQENIKLEAYKILGENQVVFWKISSAEEANIILSSKNIDEYLRSKLDDCRYFNLNEIIEICNKSRILSKLNKNILTQSLEAMNQKMFDLVLTGIATVYDGGLSGATDVHNTSIKERVNKIVEKVNKNNEIADHKDIELLGVYYSWKKSMDSYNEFIDFKEKSQEPSYINRHWIVHGRKTSYADKLDCIKMLGFLYGLVFLYDY